MKTFKSANGHVKSGLFKFVVFLLIASFCYFGWQFVDDQLISHAPDMLPVKKDPIAEAEKAWREFKDAKLEEIRNREETKEEINRLVETKFFEELSDLSHEKSIEFATIRDRELQARIDELEAQENRELIANRPF